MDNADMHIPIEFLSPGTILLIPLSIVFIFGLGEKDDKIKTIAWSVPIPQDLLAGLRDFSPLSISRVSGIYLDDVFDILNGTKERTAPEIIDKLYDTLEKLQQRDMQLDKEAARMAYLIRGFEALEQKEREKTKVQGALPEKAGKG
jgi:hypothetical protein